MIEPLSDERVAEAHAVDNWPQFWLALTRAGCGFGVKPAAPSLLQRANLQDRVLVAG